MSVQAHHDWQDSVSDWAISHPVTRRAHHAHRAPVLTDRPMVTMQGRASQGWPARRCTVEPIEHVCDRTREEFDEDDQSISADADVALWLLKGLCVVLTACFCAWLIASYAPV